MAEGVRVGVGVLVWGGGESLGWSGGGVREWGLEWAGGWCGLGVGVGGGVRVG